MDEFEKNKSPDAIVTETIYLRQLEMLAADISFDEKQLELLNEALAKAETQEPTVESKELIAKLSVDQEKVSKRVEEKYKEFSDLMDVQGFTEKLLD